MLKKNRACLNSVEREVPMTIDTTVLAYQTAIKALLASKHPNHARITAIVAKPR
jgi:hypothetical protein